VCCCSIPGDERAGFLVDSGESQVELLISANQGIKIEIFINDEYKERHGKQFSKKYT